MTNTDTTLAAEAARIRRHDRLDGAGMYYVQPHLWERILAALTKPAVPDVIRLALEDADALDREAEGADEANWQDWGALMRQAAIRIRILAALTKPAVPDVREAAAAAKAAVLSFAYIDDSNRRGAADIIEDAVLHAFDHPRSGLNRLHAALTPHQRPHACCEAERERCAKIVSGWAGDTINDNHLRIATAIRGADQ